MKSKNVLNEAERLERYFDKLPIPWPTAKEMECLSRPCKWAKILEERKDNPDVSGEW